MRPGTIGRRRESGADTGRALEFIGPGGHVWTVPGPRAMLVIAQPDLGSGLVYITIGVTALYVAGTSWRHLAAR